MSSHRVTTGQTDDQEDCAVYRLDDHRGPVFQLAGPAPEATEPTERQLAIGELMSIGMKDAAIARTLGLSVRTVRSEISLLVAALGARSRFQAGCLLARRYG
jgi:DNA-binding NarL/FixJ family response regulator